MINLDKIQPFTENDYNSPEVMAILDKLVERGLSSREAQVVVLTSLGKKHQRMSLNQSGKFLEISGEAANKYKNRAYLVLKMDGKFKQESLCCYINGLYAELKKVMLK